VRGANAIKWGTPLMLIPGWVHRRARISTIRFGVTWASGIGGAQVLCGGAAFHQNSGLEHGNYIKPTIFKGRDNMRIFQESRVLLRYCWQATQAGNGGFGHYCPVH